MTQGVTSHCVSIGFSQPLVFVYSHRKAYASEGLRDTVLISHPVTTAREVQLCSAGAPKAPGDCTMVRQFVPHADPSVPFIVAVLSVLFCRVVL